MGTKRRLILAILLLYATTTASDAVTTLVKNFHVEAQTATDITFSWDLVGGLESTSYLSTMYICFTYATNTGSGGLSCPSFSYGSTVITNGGHTFSYTFSISSLYGDYGQFIVYARVTRTNAPSDLYSKQIFVEVGNQLTVELALILPRGQTCGQVTDPSYNMASVFRGQLYRAIRLHCQLPYDFTNNIKAQGEYVICQNEHLVTFRALITSVDENANAADVISPLQTWLDNKGPNATVLINGVQYSVQGGPCGLQIPYLYSPHCGTTFTAAPTEAVSATTEAMSTQNNSSSTAVTIAAVFGAVIAIMFMIVLGLMGYIIGSRRFANSDYVSSNNTNPRVSQSVQGQARKTTAASVPISKEQPLRYQTALQKTCGAEAIRYTDMQGGEIYTEMDT